MITVLAVIMIVAAIASLALAAGDPVDRRDRDWWNVR